jgi:hypothetical protein
MARQKFMLRHTSVQSVAAELPNATLTYDEASWQVGRNFISTSYSSTLSYSRIY